MSFVVNIEKPPSVKFRDISQNRKAVFVVYAIYTLIRTSR